jgi:hypothetical protein
MIDERGEEMACLRALGLLDEQSTGEFARIAPPGSPLENLVRDLSEAAAALAFVAAVPPPQDLRQRVLSAAATGSRPIQSPPDGPRR